MMETKIPPGEGDSVGWRRTGCSVDHVAHVRNLCERFRHCWVSLIFANVNMEIITKEKRTTTTKVNTMIAFMVNMAIFTEVNMTIVTKVNLNI